MAADLASLRALKRTECESSKVPDLGIVAGLRCARERIHGGPMEVGRMFSGHGSARRRRGRNNRTARIAIPVAAVLALGVTVGIVVGASGHGTPKLRSAASSGSADVSAGVSSTAVED